MPHRPTRILPIAIALAALAGCFSDRPATGPTAPPPAGTTEVSIADFAFVPPALTVAVGTTVTWTNTDATIHTVSSDDGSTFDSGTFNQGMTFTFTAAAPGTYTYFCRIHPFMKATLTVTP